MDLIVDGYDHAIVKEGTPPANEIQKTITHLKQQCADAAGDLEYKMYCNLIAEVTCLDIILAQIHSLVNTLRDAYHPYFVKSLNKVLKTSFVFDVKDAEGYDKLLDRCIRRSGGIKIERDMKMISLKKMEEKFGKQESKPSREYFMAALITLTDESGVRLTDEITVWEFYERIRRYNKKAEKARAVSTNNKK